MNERLEQKFTDIARDAVQAAEYIDCDLETFAEGLTIIVDDLRDRLDCVKVELTEINRRAEKGGESG